ncbi:MAG: hypothetical protein AAF253_02105 [Pseudomonadota bacterium]
MKLLSLLLATAVSLSLVAAPASAQIIMGGEIMLQDEYGNTYWGDPYANDYWGDTSGGTYDDYSDWGTNPDIYEYNELNVVPDNYYDTGSDNSDWDSWGSDWADADAYADDGYGSDGYSTDW